jgi:hypothetical protein
MTTLVRYKKFEDLKKSYVSKNETNTSKAMQISELEKFLIRLRKERAKSKKIKIGE